jgi:hypothetical protein
VDFSALLIFPEALQNDNTICSSAPGKDYRTIFESLGLAGPAVSDKAKLTLRRTLDFPKLSGKDMVA